MMDTNDNENKSKNSKFKRNYKPILYIVGIVVLISLIAIEVVAIARYTSGSGSSGCSGKKPSSSPADVTPAPNTQEPGNTEVPQNTDQPTGENPTESAGNPTPTPTQPQGSTPTPTQGSTPTATPTPTPKQTPSGPTPSSGIDEVAARIIDPKDIDFSFLDGVSKEKFDDCKDNYDWYFAPVNKDENGNVTHPWDRYASTLYLLQKYGGIYRKNTNQKVCYLTFDCGYENGNTTRILDVLKEKNVQSIFFVTGGFVDYGEMTKDMMKRMLAEGHIIGSHTENHKIMPELSNEEFVEELNSVYRKLKNVLGEDFTMLFYRPPQGAATARDLALASYLGYHTTFWSFAYGDYNTSNQPDPASSLQKMKDYLHPGCVYLLHAVSSTNAEVLGDLIDYIRAEGYEIRRLDQ